MPFAKASGSTKMGKNQIFVWNSKNRAAELVSLFIEKVVGVIIYKCLGVAKFSKIIESKLKQRR